MMSRRHSLLGSLSNDSGGGVYIVKPGLHEDISIHTYLYNKYGICGSVNDPIQIEEQIYIEGFGDYTGLNGQVTYVYIFEGYSTGEIAIGLYTDESITRYYVATLSIIDGELYVRQHFDD